MTKIKIENNSFRRGDREPEKFGSWWSETDNWIKSFSISESYGDLSVDFDLEKDKDYYLLYAEYGSGDSFGNSSGNIEYFLMYQDIDKANENLDILERTSSDDMNVNLKTDSDKDIQLSNPWYGYFEHLESVQIATIRLV